MSEINKKLVKYATEAKFVEDLANVTAKVNPKSVVFIEDTGRIWTHGKYYDGAWAGISGKPTTFAPAAHTLGSHSDVALTTLATNNILKWSGSKWVNNTLAQAGIATPADITNAINAIESDVYDWTWLQSIAPPSGTCTQQQYDELLAAVQTGKIFPQAANVYEYPLPPEMGIEGVAIILGRVYIEGGYVYFYSWLVLPDLTVHAFDSSLHGTVQGIVQQEVQPLINRTVQRYSGTGATIRTIYLTSSNFPILTGHRTINVNFQGESENDGKEYVFQFTCGTTPVTINMPSNIKWIVEPYIEINKTYQISIVNRIAVIGGAS